MEALFGKVAIVIIGFIVGVPMGVAYPFSTTFKAIYVTLAITTLVVAIIGIRLRAKIIGKLLITMSLIAWTLLGLIGLGKGT